jgi:hypothetical protein
MVLDINLHDQTFLRSLSGFEESLLSFTSNPRTMEILALLGVNIIASTEPEHDRVIVARHKPALSSYDFQKICSVLSAYRFFEVISLRAQSISRVSQSTPTPCMFLPELLGGNSKDELHVSP